nr:hypothetical protein [Bacteroides sp.]
MKSVEHLTKVNYDNIYPLKKGNIIAYCRSNYNPATNAKVSMIENGKKYNVDYAIIGSSWSGVCFSELPEQLFNSILFSFYIDGEEINIIKDYLAITRISNDTSRATTLIIYSDLSENRIVEIKKQYANLRILVRSNIINKWLLDKELL